MAEVNIYIQPKINKDHGAVCLTGGILEKDSKNHYNEIIEELKNNSYEQKFECFEGYQLKYILIKRVKFDGRKRKISNDDIGNRMCELGLTTKSTDSNIFGHTYYATEKLHELMNENLNKRKNLVEEGKFIDLKELRKM